MKKGIKMIVLFFTLYVCSSVGGLLLFKIGSKNLKFGVGTNGFDISINWLVIFGILLYMISFILWLIIVSKMNLSIAMPIQVGVVNILVLIVSTLVLKESVSITQWIGTVIIIGGLFLINWKG